MNNKILILCMLTLFVSSFMGGYEVGANSKDDKIDFLEEGIEISNQNLKDCYESRKYYMTETEDLMFEILNNQTLEDEFKAEYIKDRGII